MSEGTEAKLAEIREHVAYESAHDIEGLLEGMTPDCFNVVWADPEPYYIGPEAVAERYTRHWKGFPDFEVRIRKVIAVGDQYAVTENEWRGTHEGEFLGIAATGKPVKINACVIWEFDGNRLKGEYVYFDFASVLRQIGMDPSTGRT